MTLRSIGKKWALKMLRATADSPASHERQSDETKSSKHRILKQAKLGPSLGRNASKQDTGRELS
jgi:hypothetical protein